MMRITQRFIEIISNWDIHSEQKRFTCINIYFEFFPAIIYKEESMRYEL